MYWFGVSGIVLNLVTKSYKTGWWLSIPTPLKNDGVSNSWDHEIPNRWNVIIHSFQTTNQAISIKLGHVFPSWVTSNQ